MNTTTIYGELVEGSAEPMFAPVPAEYLGKRFYKILEHGREDYDTLRFNTGTYVICLLSKLEPTEQLVPMAYCDIAQDAVEYILSYNQK